jgi:hypothetical protein
MSAATRITMNIIDAEAISQDLDSLISWLNGYREGKGSDFSFPFSLLNIEDLHSELLQQLSNEYQNELNVCDPDDYEPDYNDDYNDPDVTDVIGEDEIPF